jgi:hypothetical protein
MAISIARRRTVREHNAWAFKAVEADRYHVEQTIQRAHCDVDVTTDRRGRPYTLVCTKNQASYDRRAKQRRKDLEHVIHLCAALLHG